MTRKSSTTGLATGGKRRTSFSSRLKRLGELAVKVGVDLKPGQDLIIQGPNTPDARALARAINRAALRQGVGQVYVLYTDDIMKLDRFRLAHDANLDTAPKMLIDAMIGACKNGSAARIRLDGENPSLLSGQDPSRVARTLKAYDMAYKPMIDLLSASAYNWTIVPCATTGWAKVVFPDEPARIARAKLWEALFACTRVDSEDPVAAWASHNERLHRRRALLNARRYAALQFNDESTGTDLYVGLADDHEWMGGQTPFVNGSVGNCNIPQEENFTTPHRLHVSGLVGSSRPLAYKGTIIENIRLRFLGGTVVGAWASKGLEALNKMLDSDEGARRLGEIALVPHGSPISKSGILFYSTLLDENAASHGALGKAYQKCIINGLTMPKDELARRGFNFSIIHVDFMIGSGRMNVDGIRIDGTREPLMINGEFVGDLGG